MNNWILTILLAVAATVIGALLVGAYVVAPIIDWLISNPFAGVVLLVIFFVLAATLFHQVTRD